MFNIELEYMVFLFNIFRPHILFPNARGIRVLFFLDEATNIKKFGYYARVLVDINLFENHTYFPFSLEEGLYFLIIMMSMKNSIHSVLFVILLVIH